jgi:hypothetical protein
MSTIPTREEAERLAAVMESLRHVLNLWPDLDKIEGLGTAVEEATGASATALRALSSRVEELEAREHAAWKLGYASGISAAKKGDAP